MPHPDADRGSTTVAVAAAAALLLLVLAAVAGAVGGITGQEASVCTAQPAASSTAASIPADYLADFKAAGTEYGIPWTVLAAIGEVESGFGQNDGPSSAGALGPMQFEPSTWALYGDGGNIMNPGDAIPAAARLPVASGAPGNLQQAVFAYNHSAAYVTDVLDQAAAYAAGGAQVISAAGIAIPRTAAAQWDWGTQIPASQVQPGDLVFFAGADGTPAAPGHVGIVLNPAAHTMIDACTGAFPVEEDTYGLADSKGGLSPVVGFTRPVGTY